MFEQLDAIVKRCDELTQLLSDPAVIADPDALRNHAKEQAELRPIVASYQEYGKVRDELQDNRELLANDTLEEEFAELVREEVATLEARLKTLEQELRLALLPQ